jgi:hypothetical protein
MKAFVVKWLRQTKLVRRLNKLSQLKQDYARVAVMKRMLPTSALFVRLQYDLTLLGIAFEFESQRYWWIKPLRQK